MVPEVNITPYDPGLAIPERSSIEPNSALLQCAPNLTAPKGSPVSIVRPPAAELSVSFSCYNGKGNELFMGCVINPVPLTHLIGCTGQLGPRNCPADRAQPGPGQLFWRFAQGKFNYQV